MPRSLILALLLLAYSAAPGQEPAAFDAGEYDIAARTILCDCGCHPQSVHACACGRASEMRREIGALIAKGMSGEQVVEYYVDLRGEQIRIAPKAEGFNLVAWLGPLVALFVASTLMIVILRRWSRDRPDDATAASELPVNEAYRQRLRDALEKFD